MKIFGVAPSKRSRNANGVDVSAGSSSSALAASATTPDAGPGGDEEMIVGLCAKPSVPSLSSNVWQCYGSTCQQSCLCPSSLITSTIGASNSLSDGCIRLLRTLGKDPPVDLCLERPPLRTAADLAAVFQATSIGSFRTLTLGPWSSDGCDFDDVDAAIRVFGNFTQVWGTWPLRRIEVRQCRLVNPSLLLAALHAIPLAIETLVLVGLRLGERGNRSLGQVLNSLASRDFNGNMRLDIGSNGIIDADLAVLEPLLIPREGEKTKPPIVSGLGLSDNPQVTDRGVHRLLSTAHVLHFLDLSECQVGPSGAQCIGEFLRKPDCKLRDLVLYRCGLGMDGVLAVVAAGVEAQSLRSLDVKANSQHIVGWSSTVGSALASQLKAVASLRVLTISCPEAELKTVKELFSDLPVQVILVPNEQNNYNRAMFGGMDSDTHGHGHVH